MQRQVLPTFPIYEHNGRQGTRKQWIDLRHFAWEPDPVDDGKLPISVFRKTTYLHVIRRNLFSTLQVFQKAAQFMPSVNILQWKRIYKNTRRDQNSSATP